MDSSIDQMASVPASPATSTVVKSNATSVVDPRYAAYVPAPAVGSSTTVTNANSPFYVHTNNSPSHKFKYPETAPTPDGEDDHQWGKIYTAADSRHYNHHNKSSTESKKFRVSGETYTLALKMLVENKQKYATAVQMAIAAGMPIPTDIPRATPKPGSTPRATPKSDPQPRNYAKKEQSFSESRGGGDLLSISESLKLQGRTARQTSVASSFLHNQSASPSQQEMAPAKKNSPAPGARPRAKVPGTVSIKTTESHAMKRNGETVTKGIAKKAKIDADSNDYVSEDRPVHSPVDTLFSKGLVANHHHRPQSTTNHWAELDHGRNANGEKIYCECRQPDDRTNMIQCSNAVCSEWFHIKCVGLTLHDAEVVVEYFYCVNCETNELFTTFKRVCRVKVLHDKGHKQYPQCWELARVNEGSKYCSDEHAAAYWRYIIKYTLRGDKEASMGGRLNVEEFATLIRSGKLIEHYRKFGDFPLLPRQPKHDPNLPVGADYLNDEEDGLILALQSLKERTAEHLTRVQCMAKFYQMVEARAVAAAEYLSVDVHSFCGYDNRLAMNDEQFAAYLATEEGIKYTSTGILGPATADAKNITGSIPSESVVSVEPASGCIVPDPLNNICLEPWVHNHKSKKNCQHNTVGSIWWRNKHSDELRYKQHLIRSHMANYDRLIKEVYDQAEVRGATAPLYRDQVTEVFD